MPRFQHLFQKIHQFFMTSEKNENFYKSQKIPRKMCFFFFVSWWSKWIGWAALAIRPYRRTKCQHQSAWINQLRTCFMASVFSWLTWNFFCQKKIFPSFPGRHDASGWSKRGFVCGIVGTKRSFWKKKYKKNIFFFNF